MDPKQQALLEQIGRKGWSVISATPNTEFTAGSYPGERVPKYPEGAETWVISDGKGQNQTLVVKSPAPYPGPYAATTNDPGAYNPNYTVVEPPKDLPASATNTKNVQTYTDPNGTLWERDDATGGWNQAKGVPAGSKTSGRTAAEESLSQAQADAIKGKTPGEIDELAARGVLTRAQAQAVKDKTPAEIDQMVASAANARASAAATAAKTPAEIADLQSRARQGDAAALKTLQDMAFAAVPKYGEATPTSGPQQTITDPTTGQQTTQPNPNYVPTDPVLRGQQLSARATAKHQDLQQQILNGQVTPEEAMTQWNDYWNTQVEPIRQEIQQAQQQTQLENQLKVNQDARATDTLAGSAANNLMSQAQTGATTGAGLLQNRASNAQSMINNVLGIGTGSKNFGIGGGGAPDVSGLPGAVGSYLTNMGGGQGVYDTAVNLVRGIDPNNQSGFAAHAAAALSQVMDRAQQQAAGTYQYGGGMPQPQPVDSTLNRSTYGAFGTAPAAPTTTIAPDGTVTIAHSPAIPDYAAASISDPSRAMG